MDKIEIISNDPPRLSDSKERLIDIIIKYSIPVRGNIYRIPEALGGFSKQELYNAIYDNCVFVRGPSTVEEDRIYRSEDENVDVYYSVKYVGPAPFVFVGKGINTIFVKDKEVLISKEKEHLVSHFINSKDFVVETVNREIDPIIEYARQKEEQIIFGDNNNEKEEELW